MKPELLFLILFLFGFVLHCFLGNNRKIEGMNAVETAPTFSSNPSYYSDSDSSTPVNSSNPYASSSYENYNHYNGTSIATKYYGPNGEVVVINNPSSITVINVSGTSVEYRASASSDSSTNIEAVTFVGPNGEFATFVSGSNGGKAVKITDAYGTSVIYGEKPASSASFTNPLRTYYGSTSPATEYPPHTYDSSFPQGIPKSQILPGQEDLYILKSQVVPPVCPACNPVVIYKDKECQACPACARCPEPNFECKKVPNYNAINNSYLPTPILNSFSGFGM